MALAGLTDQSVTEAGIAANLAADPQLLPEPSIWFQDFNFGETMWDAAYGNVDGGSVSGVGEAVADIAIENVLEAERIKREDDNPAKDASMLIEAGDAHRERMADMQRLEVGGITMTVAEWDMVREGLDNPETQAQVKSNMRERGYSDTQIDAARHWAHVLSGIAEWQANNPGQPLPADMQAQLDEYERQPQSTKESTDVYLEETLEVESNRTSRLDANQTADLDAAVVDSEAVAINSLEAQGFNQGEAAELAEWRTESSAGFALSDEREGPVITDSYNVEAEGRDVEVAQVQELPIPAARSEMALGG